LENWEREVATWCGEIRWMRARMRAKYYVGNTAVPYFVERLLLFASRIRVVCC
jgi:hypothetical protein